jgi:hypothetical protein
MSYTDVSKPTDATYTAVYTQGRQVYNQSDIDYDGADTFYDSVDVTAYTDIAKPAGGGETITAGRTLGMLIPLTVPSVATVGSNPWTKINKPT